MIQILTRRLLVAGIALLIVPSALLAQKLKEKEKEKMSDDGKSVQQITITRNTNKDEKTVIEIDGDKVKINGKDASDNKDVRVHVNNMKRRNNFYRVSPDAYAFNFNDNMTLLDEDNNRAMLGVVTEGNDKGAEIQSITKESAAEKAGLKKGDIITRIGDKKIESTEDVTDAVHERKPGEKVNITVLRDGKEEKMTAELGKWKGIKMNAMSFPRIQGMGGSGSWNESPMPPMTFGETFVSTGRPKLGLSIQDTDDGNGVKVLDVDNESAAEKAGIKEDDVIVAIDDQPVKGTEDITKTIREHRDKNSFNFKVLRDGKTQTMEVKIPRKLKTADL
jgi:Trypsin-like serine proteases, typically periplasmic, contain C-terminal PDZ domain